MNDLYTTTAIFIAKITYKSLNNAVFMPIKEKNNQYLRIDYT